MKTIINAYGDCEVSGKFFLFDANVWLYIYGNDPRPEKAVYSDFYGKIISSDNEVIVNEHVLSEFFNRFCKIEFEALFGRNRWRDYKALRKSDVSFKERVEAIKDICLEILSDCTYQQSSLRQDRLEENLRKVSGGELDLTDAALVSECVRGDYILVSHDGDFASSEITLATANNRVLGVAR